MPVAAACHSCRAPIPGGETCAMCRAILSVANPEPSKPDLVDPLQCPRCGERKQRADWIVCIGCAVTFDEESIRAFAKARDDLADWLTEAADLLNAMPDDDPRKPGAVEKWRQRNKNHMALCWMLRDVSPEAVA